ncbi:MAG: hypothetical protein ABI847_16300, partial [Anaerolineales bacterium]
MSLPSRLGRRAFLKLGLAGAAAALLPQWPVVAAVLPRTASGLPSVAATLPRIASALPLPVPHRYQPDAESWLLHPPHGVDLVLAPAH